MCVCIILWYITRRAYEAMPSRCSARFHTFHARYHITTHRSGATTCQRPLNLSDHIHPHLLPRGFQLLDPLLNVRNSSELQVNVFLLTTKMLARILAYFKKLTKTPNGKELTLQVPPSSLHPILQSRSHLGRQTAKS